MADGMVDHVISGLPALPDDLADDRLLPVFVFVDLHDADFMAQLLEHPVRWEPARLFGYRVELLADLVWPIIVDDDDGVVDGRLFRGLGAEDLRRLDANQGVGEGLYRRQAVTVRIGQGDEGSVEDAFVYLPTDRTLLRYPAVTISP